MLRLDPMKRQTPRNLADPLNAPQFVFELASFLRITPDQLLLQLTTLSYWNAFARQRATAPYRLLPAVHRTYASWAPE